MSKAMQFTRALNLYEAEHMTTQISAKLKKIADQLTKEEIANYWEGPKDRKKGKKEMGPSEYAVADLTKRFPQLSKEDIAVLNRYIRSKAIVNDVADMSKEDLKKYGISAPMGNLKLYKNILCFNLPPIRTCPHHSKCAKECYAKRATVQYSGKNSVAYRNEVNYRLAREMQEELKDQLQSKIDQLKGKKNFAVRIHESGDFFSQAYIDLWNDVVKSNPDVLFYAYTKTESMFDFSKLKSNKNFNLVSSYVTVDGKQTINFAPQDEINFIKAKLSEEGINIPICPCLPGNKVICGGDTEGKTIKQVEEVEKKTGKTIKVIHCNICKTPGNNQVLFVQH